MAESYRGLTVRINGDTTNLNAALKATRQAASGVQSDLRKISQALKLDPTSLKASQLQMGAIAEQVANTADRVTTLNEALKQVGASVPEGASQTIKEMADSTQRAHMNAALAQEDYNRLTKSLATAYTELSKLHSEAAKGVGKKLASDLTDSVKDMDFSGIKDSLKEVRSTFGDT